MSDSDLEELISAKLTTRKLDGSYLDLAVQEMVRHHQVKLLKWWAVPATAALTFLSILGINNFQKFEEFEKKVADLERKAIDASDSLEKAKKETSQISESFRDSLRDSQRTANEVSKLIVTQASETSAATRNQADFFAKSLDRQANVEKNSREFAEQLKVDVERSSRDLMSQASQLNTSFLNLSKKATELEASRNWQTRVLEATTFDSLVMLSHETSRPIVLPTRGGGAQKVVFETFDIDDELNLRYFVDGKEIATLALSKADRGRWRTIDGTNGLFGFRLEQIFHVRGGFVKDFITLSVKRNEVELMDQPAPSNFLGPGSKQSVSTQLGR